MSYWSKPAAPRSDLRLLQAQFDAQAREQQAAALADIRRTEPALVTGFGVLVLLFVVATLIGAAIPSIGSGL